MSLHSASLISVYSTSSFKIQPSFELNTFEYRISNSSGISRRTSSASTSPMSLVVR